MKISMTSYTLTHAELIHAGLAFSFMLTLISLGGIFTLRKDPKKLSWVISLFNSGLMTIAGIFYLTWHVIQSPQYFYLIKLINLENNTDFSVLCCLWFGLANLFDLALGVVFYKKYLGFLTAWIHHTAFIWVVFTMVTGNGGIVTGLHPFSISFANLLIEELPTFLLALGSIFPACRTDVGFGATFFIFRLVYHFYFFFSAVRLGTQKTHFVIYTLTGVLHVNWFWNWIMKYSGVAGGDKGKKEPEGKKSI